MRTIKFRGKRIDNGEWVEGYYVYDHAFGGNEKHYIFVMETMGPFTDFNRYEIIPETLGQSTGLYDKNGKEIFEGDVVHIISNSTDITHTVIFKDGSFCIDNNLFTSFIHIYNIGFSIEIIGNIHETGEEK